MFAKLFSLTRPLIVFDLETTGLRGSRILEFAFESYRPDGTTSAYRTLVNPGIPIPPETTAVHGITDDDMARCQRCAGTPDEHPHDACQDFRPIPRWEGLAQNAARGLSDCDFGGKNIRFDLEVMTGEMRRVGVPWSYRGAAILDADRLEAILEPRDLASLYRRRTGREPEGAHRADNDVRMTAEVLVDQIVRGEGALPRDLRQLHELQWPGWIDSEGRFRRRKTGEVALSFGQHRDVDVRRVPPTYWKWMAGADFSDEVKDLARECAAGRFPK